MTRVLSELLGAREPVFHQNLMKLEAASGHTSADIRLSAEIGRLTRAKLRQLGLDPDDTTGTELYAALQQRVRTDDARLTRVLCQKYGEAGEAHVTIAKALSDLPVPKSCFALKTSVGKRLLMKQPPKQTVRALGYRSFDSMMRREPVLAIFAAAWLLESASWHRMMTDAYKKLTPADFEIRAFTFLSPSSKHWHALSETVVAHKKHNVIALKEFGALVILPFTSNMPPAMTLTALLIALHEMNEVRSASVYLKLCQVRPDFGHQVQMIVADEPILSAALLDGSVPWHIIQRYYARFGERFREELFEPHVQKEDLTWHSVEKALSFIEPGLAFWHHTAALGIVDDHRPVSFNVIDAALNFCNQLPYKDRIAHYLRRNLWSELVIRYLRHENVEQTVVGSLESQLVPAGPDSAAESPEFV